MALVYPFENAPESNQAVDIHPDVKWVRSPLPMSLNHINCYLLRDDDGWAVVDTGMNLPESKKLWLEVIEKQLNGAPITKVIVTHQHPDHIGLCGWFCDTYRVPLYITEREYFYTRAFISPRRESLYWATEEYLERTDITEETKQQILNSGGYGQMVAEMPSSYRQVKDLEKVKIGNHVWQGITTRGHSPEHLSLYCEELDLLISGDQVLPGITSNVSVSPTNAEASPLTDWYESHDKIHQLVPDTVTVLPSHELPFKGLHERLDEVIAHHDERIDEIYETCKTPKTAQEITRTIFRRDLEPFQNFLAVGEAIAHLHKMMEDDKIERTLDNGVYLYSSL